MALPLVRRSRVARTTTTTCRLTIIPVISHVRELPANSDDELGDMHRRHFQMSATQRELQRVMGTIDAFCVANKLPDSISNHMKLALDEVLSNIIKYAYGKSGPGLIDVDLTYANNKFVATVQDSGIPFDPLQRRPQVSRGPLRSRKEGGLGIVFVKSLMDSVAYERCGDRNKVVLTLEVPPPRVDHPARG